MGPGSYMRSVVDRNVMRRMTVLNCHQGSFLAVNRQRFEADHSPLPRAEVQNEWIYTSTQASYNSPSLDSIIRHITLFHISRVRTQYLVIKVGNKDLTTAF